MPRLTAPPPVSVDYSWERSAAVHEAWYQRTLRASLDLQGEHLSLCL